MASNWASGTLEWDVLPEMRRMAARIERLERIIEELLAKQQAHVAATRDPAT